MAIFDPPSAPASPRFPWLRPARSDLRRPFLFARMAARSLKLDRDIRRRWGPAAPTFCERLWIPVAELTRQSNASGSVSAEVRDGDWDLDWTPLRENPKIRYCVAHWRDGLSWEDAGAWDYMMASIARLGVYDGCRSASDVEMRFRLLDDVFETVSRERRIRPVSEYRKFTFREKGGLMIHLDRDGRPQFAGGGHHRVGMAIALDLPVIPAMPMLVHPSGISALPRYRQPAGH